MIDFTKSPSTSVPARPSQRPALSVLGRLPWALIGFLAVCALIAGSAYLAEGDTPSEMGLPYWAVGISALSLMVCGLVSVSSSNLHFLFMAMAGMSFKFMTGFVSAMSEGVGADQGNHGAQLAIGLTETVSSIGTWGGVLITFCAALIAIGSTYESDSSSGIADEVDA